MRLTELPILAVVGCCSLSAAAALTPELVDLAARIEYGFYASDAQVIRAARAALDRVGESQDAVYYRDLAALRLAQLGVDDRQVAVGVEACAERAPENVHGKAAAELWILVGACNALEDGSVRRVEQALARARALDRGNPRIAVVEAWVLERQAGRDAAAHDAMVAKLQQALAAFDAWNAPPGAPDWGYAETLATLGDATLQRGEIRAARDLIERALFAAPDYRYAVELRSKLVGLR